VGYEVLMPVYRDVTPCRLVNRSASQLLLYNPEYVASWYLSAEVHVTNRPGPCMHMSGIVSPVGHDPFQFPSSSSFISHSIILLCILQILKEITNKKFWEKLIA
jgi:hypothetical protein